MKNVFLITGILCMIVSLPAQEVVAEKDMIFVAHRGASYLAPENTMASIQLAWELGAD